MRQMMNMMTEFLTLFSFKSMKRLLSASCIQYTDRAFGSLNLFLAKTLTDSYMTVHHAKSAIRHKSGQRSFKGLRYAYQDKNLTEAYI